MSNIKKAINTINKKELLDDKLAMVEVLNIMTGNDFDILNGRVVYKEGIEWHDAYVNIP